jgi:hypothetical protein
MRRMEARTDTTSTRARWTGLATLGLALAALASLIVFLAGLVWGLELGADSAFLLVGFLVPAIGAFLVWRFGTWGKVAGIVLALVTGGLLSWTAFGLASPQSFFDFVPGLLVVPGCLIAIGASIAAIRAGRRGEPSGEDAGSERRAVKIVLAVVGVLAAASAILTVASRSTVDGSEADTEVVLSNFEYAEPSYEVPGGGQVVVRNTDPFLHTFTVDDLDIDVSLGPNGSALVDIPDQPGGYVVYCRPHTMDPDAPGEDDMASELTIG